MPLEKTSSVQADRGPVIYRSTAEQEDAEERSETVRVARDTFSTDHGGKLRVDDLVDVAPTTARRWLRLGIARPGDSAPLRPQLDAAAGRPSADQLQAEIARLQSLLATATAPATATAQAGPANPFAEEGEHDLTEGASVLGDTDHDDGADEDGDDDDDSPPATRRRSHRRKG